MFNKGVTLVRACSRSLTAWALLLPWSIAFIAVPHAALSAPVPIWTHFTRENSDLPNDHVLALAGGSDGVLWVATAGGLARLDEDGRWHIYTKASTKNGLPDDHVRALALRSDNTLWVGTSGGLARLDKDGRWQTYTTVNTAGGLPDNDVSAIALGSDGATWVGTSEGLARLDKKGHWQTYTKAKTNGGLINDDVSAVALAADGAVWVATRDGLSRLDKDGSWHSIGTDSGLGPIAISSDGIPWVARVFDVARIDKNGYWQPLTKDQTGGQLVNDVITVAFASDGTLWVGRRSGLAHLAKDGEWQTYTNANTNGGLPAGGVSAVAVGFDGVLWVGTEAGLARLDTIGIWRSYTDANTDGGLPDNVVTALALNSDGATFVATEGGLARLDTDGRWRTYTKANTNGGLPQNLVSHFALGSDGGMWAGTGSGLVRLDKGGNWRTYTKANTNGSLPTDNVWAVAIGSDGATWVGTESGLARLDKGGHWRTYTKANTNGGLTLDGVSLVAVGSDGAIWVRTGSFSSSGGLSRLDQDGRWRTYTKANTNGGLPGDTVRAVAFSSDGALWVGTEGGLACLDKDGQWRTYTKTNTNGGLVSDDVSAVAVGSDGAVWVGMGSFSSFGGLSRLDKDGHWQTYTNANTAGGLPSDVISALAVASDGALWIGTDGGVGHLTRAPKPTHQIVDVIGNSGAVSQREQILAVVAFDRSYQTQPDMFRYVWRIREEGPGSEGALQEVSSRSPVYRAEFKHDGTYRVQVFAVDRYGMWSEPRELTFKVTTPQADPLRDMFLKLSAALASVGILYFVFIFPLIPLYPRFSWARTATNSGVFTKFPLLHKEILNTAWARRRLLFRLAKSAVATSLPDPYIPQSLFAAKQAQAQQIILDGSSEGLKQLFAIQRRALLVARSGTGKSVFLRYLHRQVAARFLRGENVPAPILIDLRTHVLSGRSVSDLVRDALRGAGVELSDADLEFLIRKGGFLILIDSLNELSNLADARLFHTFFNQDAYNRVIIASQQDLIGRDDIHLFNLAEVTPEQAATYLAKATGRDLYSSLPAEAQILARNPQDLVLLAEVARALGTAPIPTRRAELYREILAQDGALRGWVKSSDPRLAVIYALAFRMVAEQHVLQEEQLREWIAAELEDGGDALATVIAAIQASGLFITEVQRDVLGKERSATGFRHELIGKFLASRHVRRSIAQAHPTTTVDYVTLSGDYLWSDVFYFALDEMETSQLLNRFLMDILSAGGPVRMRIAAYAIGTKNLAEPSGNLRQAYASAKLKEDLALTPAA